MHWTDEGVILSARPHGESSVIVELLTRDHGRHLGLVRGGRSRTQRPVLQPGNLVRAEWRARLDDHLGNFALEGLTFRAARLMEARASVFGLAWLSALTRLLPERDPHPAVFETLGLVLDHLEDNEIAPALMIRFELAMLSELGFRSRSVVLCRDRHVCRSGLGVAEVGQGRQRNGRRSLCRPPPEASGFPDRLGPQCCA